MTFLWLWLMLLVGTGIGYCLAKWTTIQYIEGETQNGVGIVEFNNAIYEIKLLYE